MWRKIGSCIQFIRLLVILIIISSVDHRVECQQFPGANDTLLNAPTRSYPHGDAKYHQELYYGMYNITYTKNFNCRSLKFSAIDQNLNCTNTNCLDVFNFSAIALGTPSTLVLRRSDGIRSVPFIDDMFWKNGILRVLGSSSCITDWENDVKFEFDIENNQTLTLMVKLLKIKKCVANAGLSYIGNVQNVQLSNYISTYKPAYVNVTVIAKHLRKSISIPVQNSIPDTKPQHKLVTATNFLTSTPPKTVIRFLEYHLSIGFDHFYLYAHFPLERTPVDLRNAINAFAIEHPGTITITPWFNFFE